MIPEIKNSKQVSLKDRVRFRCKRCGECCRNAKATVALDSLDGYRLAKHLGVSVEDFYLKYADFFILDEESRFPIYTLKVKGQKAQCIFLEGNRCTVRDARPGTCRMYPFWVEPTSADGSININYCFERRQHEKGSPIKVQDWEKENLDSEKREMLNEDYRIITTLAPLLHRANELCAPSDMIENLLRYYRFLNYDTEQPYLEQMKRNNYDLIEAVKAFIGE